MIFDLIAPEKIVVDKCIPVLEELALLNENPFGHLTHSADAEEEIDLDINMDNDADVEWLTHALLSALTNEIRRMKMEHNSMVEMCIQYLASK